MAIEQRQPTGYGITAAGWQLGAGTDRLDAVDDTLGANDGDTTYIFQTVSGQYQDYTFPVFTVPAGATINHVTVRGYFKYVGTGSDVRLNIANETPTRSEGADISVASSASYGELTRQMTTNPFTAAAWTVNEVNTEGSTANRLGQFGVRSIGPNTDIRCTQLWLEVDYTEAVGGGLSVFLEEPIIGGSIF